MNCPSRVDPEALPKGWNQNPNAFAADTNNDSNGIANLRRLRDHIIPKTRPPDDQTATDGPKEEAIPTLTTEVDKAEGEEPKVGGGSNEGSRRDEKKGIKSHMRRMVPHFEEGTFGYKAVALVKKYVRFIGPGFLVSVAYIDPGNYATDVAAGASYKFRLLVMVLVSNLIAIFLQSLCVKLGSVTGMNLAENIKANCPQWLNLVLYFFGECAIIATDIAEVIGTAIALYLLLHIPLVAGCAISIVDVLFILLFYNPNGGMRGLRIFECFVIALVLGVVVCFSVELSLITVPNVGELFRGYLPSHALVESQGLYQACGILGATVMPHSLYLGSGIVQPRLRDFDVAHGNVSSASANDPDSAKYKPTLGAIQHCLKISIVELAISLFTFALFVNSAILIVAGASLSGTNAAEASLFGVHDLLSHTLAPVAGTIFALALLLSGTSAGIVCTIAGQMVSEGQLTWTVKPWVRRLITRSISITPSIIIAGAVGKDGLTRALEGSQVALSVILPFVSAPLIYFTCRNKFMIVESPDYPDGKKMRNNWITASFAIGLWLLIVVMNVALLVLAGMGNA